MKVLLINPPVRDFNSTPLRRLPLGLLYVAASLRERGHEVLLLDSGASREEILCNPPPAMRDRVLSIYANDSAPFRLFGQYHHFGPGFDALEEGIKAIAPEAVGISSLFSPYAREAEETAAAARRAAPGAPVIVGGGHASAFPESVLRNPNVDFVVLGEGESAFPDLVDALAAGRGPSRIAGVGCRKGRKVIVTPPVYGDDVDAIPLPARDLLDQTAYVRRGRVFTQILSSRGCPQGCTFCSAHLTTGRSFRPRRPELVVEEMKLCHDRHAISLFDFEDDNLTLERDRALRLMKLIRGTFGPNLLRLEALNGISYRGLDEELCEALYEAGMRTLHLAPLTAEARSLEAMKRAGAHAEFLEAARCAVDTGLDVTAYVMVGYPGQTLDEIMETLDALTGEEVRVCPSVFYPAAGSQIQKDLLPHLEDADADEWAAMRATAFPAVPGGLPREILRTVFWMAHMAEFAGTVVPERDMARLFSLCTATAAAAAFDTIQRESKTWTVRTPRPLNERERGLEAIAGYLRMRHPCGVRLLHRGKQGKPWKYSVFPLPGLLEDKAFYRRWSIPGFNTLER